MRYLCGISIFAALLGATLAIGLSAETKQQVPPSAEPLATAQPEHRDYYKVGASGCSATACHGSIHADSRASGTTSTKIRRDEYILWSDRDPHARSLQSLQKPLGRAMLAKLGIRDIESGEILDARGYNNCLACHATPVVNPVKKTVEHESVSCEACHGHAEKWRDTHYQAGWKRDGSDGFIDLKIARASDASKLTARAETCALCHVGAADREVNHDLIAAGHPALKFELAAYHDLLPKHWNDVRERAAIKDFEVTLWSAGQKATLKQSLSLLTERIDRQLSPTVTARAPVKPVWPEFAEFDCFACHHGLTPSPWREAGADPKIPVPWNAWNLGATDTRSLPAIDTLRQRMNENPRATAELLDIVRTARQAVAQIDFTPGVDSPPSTRWDSATQSYLLLAARVRAHRDDATHSRQPWPEQAEAQSSLRAMRQLLVFDGDRAAPSDKGGPKEFEKLRAQIERLLDQGDR